MTFTGDAPDPAALPQGEPSVLPAAALTWATPSEAVRVVLHRPHLWRTTLTALVVGTVLFAINQLDVVLAGDADAITWLKAGLTYLVPFGVANTGLLFGCRRR